MDAEHQDFKYKELTGKIIKIFYMVYNKREYSFLELVRVQIYIIFKS